MAMKKISRRGFKLVCGAVLLGLVATGCVIFGERETEETISMNALPAAVRTAAEKEVAGGKVVEVEKETEHGKVVYEVVYNDPSGTLMELEYAEDGTLLSKEKED
jgi:uncharacterized membrane protein YkoI